MSGSSFFLFAQAANDVVLKLQPQAQPQPWVWDTFAWSMLSTVSFGLIGIALAILGFKLFDYLTPGKLEDEILQKQNIAAAILGGAMVLGICLIVSRAVS